MKFSDHPRLVEWVAAQHRAGTLGNCSLADVCARATAALGIAVDHMDYIAARRDKRCVVAMGGAIGDAHDLLVVDQRIAHSARRRGGETGARPRKSKPDANTRLAPLETPLDELPLDDARKVLIAKVVEAARLVCGVTIKDILAPGQGWRDVSAARNIVAFTVAGLLPDEKVHGVAMLLSQHVGRSDQAWHKRLDRATCAKSDRLATLQAQVDEMLEEIGIEPLPGVVYRKPGRPRKSVPVGGGA